MTDVEILKALGVSLPAAEPTVVQGKDGTSATYSAGKQRVTITRSLVSGLTVIASGPLARVWTAERP